MTLISDPIADLLTRIRNASAARLRFADMPATKLKLRILDIMLAAGYISDYAIKEELPQNTVRVFLKYNQKQEPIFRGLKRISCSSRRQYVQAKNIPSVFGKMGTVIISTSQGVMSGKDAIKANLGGELLCSIW